MFFYYLRLALVSLRQTPAVSALMLLAIAIGIGISMTTLVLHTMRSADPIPHKSDKLAVIQLQSQGVHANFGSSDNLHKQLTYHDTVAMLESDIPQRSTAMYRAGLKIESLEPGKEPSKKAVLLTTSDFFSMFEAPLLYGQAWDAKADEYAEKKTVIGRQLNQQLFGGENSVGQKILIQNNIFEIVGVLDNWQPVPKYYDTIVGAFNHTEQVFVPFSHARANELDTWHNNWGNVESWNNESINVYQQFLDSESHWLHAWAEFESEQQKQDFATFIQGYIDQQQQLGRFAREDATYDLKDVMTWLNYRKVVGTDNYILLVLSFLFLAVCLVNTLGLMLSKFLRRAPDVGVRRALGANRSQIFIQHLVEVGVLGLIGGCLGLLLSYFALNHLKQYNSEYQLLAQLDVQMMLIAPALAIGVTLLAGVYPAWRICQTQPARYLKSQ
ncbi:ABC transporter ATP-binding protein [Saccharobesus litoralis]|uniref:ABC transporter ATP-binding protein n=1 Tax=Saccharobesus litoralis TaxID=2172099 RepID=A0A2S0VQU8_9ALTE|nr:FtsX-like permease family protein [Saccharobesus litoralis]AWB66591.1 ABC transporter ATP-binding protein [Saccharobesus litoralis]